jgi:hypothetical protein
MAKMATDEVLKQHGKTLMSIPDVVGTEHDLC